jgi:pyrroloquinoline quinone biosynthesis protein B
MFIKVLGAAAGGAFPQWNCSCSNCRRLRQGRFHGAPRSQAQLAISANRRDWFLINASPDLRYQIESFPSLHPLDSITARHSPVQAVVLLSAELDAALGLLLLRESQPFAVYATGAVRRLLVEDNNMFGVLRRHPDQVRWRDLCPGRPVELCAYDQAPSGITCTPVSAGGGFPGHISSNRAAELPSDEATLGLYLSHGTKRVALFPSAASVSLKWLEAMEDCDAVFFDGTFWSDDELIRIQGAGKTAAQMGHLAISGKDGTLARFSTLKKPRKIFIHINNTNPMLDLDSPEYRQICDAGWELATDGMELQL